MARAAKKENNLKWWQLSMLGVAFTIGSGFFLGSHLAIEIGGPAALLAYVISAFSAYLVFEKLALMTADEPLEGSFRSYAKKAYGRWAGFSSGWVYWISEILIVGSELAALGLFTRFWFPQMPTWLLAVGYGVLGLLVVVVGAKSFERLENLFGIMKIAAILLFVILAVLAIFGVFHTAKHGPAISRTWFPTGWTGLWASLIFAFYGFGGLEVTGMMAVKLRHPEQARKAGLVMMIMLGFVYVLSLGLALILEPWTSYMANESPFVVSLTDYRLAFVPHLFNAVLIIGGFSTLAASLYAVTSMLVTLAGEGDAPRIFAVRRRRGGAEKSAKPWAAIALTTAGLGGSVLFALLMPRRVYEYMTTAAGLMLLYNCLFILMTSGRLLKSTGWGHVKRYLGIALVLLIVSGSWFHDISRPGLYISLGFVAAIAGVTLLMQRIWKRAKTAHASSPGKYTIRFESEIKAKADQGQPGYDRHRRKEPAR